MFFGIDFEQFTPQLTEIVEFLSSPFFAVFFALVRILSPIIDIDIF